MRPAPALLLSLVVACSTHQVELTRPAPATLPQEPPGHETGEVVRVVDGDTIEVEITGRREGAGIGEAVIGRVYDVRLIGIDTPESVKPGSPVECFGKESSAATEALLDGRSVSLVKDVEETDRYDRLLRYVYIGDEMVNARLVLNGYAQVYTYPPNIRWSELLVQLEREARGGDRGLWASNTCGGDT